MTSRLVRHLLYGSFYILATAVIFWIIYILFLRPAPTCFDGRRNQGETGIDCGGPCSSCEITQLKDLVSDWAMALPGRENESSLLAEIYNPNLNFGAQTFSYQFNVIGPFGPLKTIKGESFIYPGEIKYLIEPSLKINLQDVSRVELKIDKDSILWQSEKELVKPLLTTRSVKTEVVNQEIKVEGYIKNENPLLISKIKIIAVLFDRQNEILNASFTTIADLKGLTEGFFSIGLPKGNWTEQLDLNRTKIFIEPEPKF